MVSETSPKGLEDVTENLWDTHALMGTMVPEVGLIEHTGNHVVMAIIPYVEQIQGMKKPPVCLISFRDFGKVMARASGLLCGVKGADAWGWLSLSLGYTEDALCPGTRCTGPTAWGV